MGGFEPKYVYIPGLNAYSVYSMMQININSIEILAFKWLKNPHGARMIVQQLRTHTAFAEDASFVPSTHIRQLTPTYNSSSRSSTSFFWPLQVLNSHSQIHIYIHEHRHTCMCI